MAPVRCRINNVSLGGKVGARNGGCVRGDDDVDGGTGGDVDGDVFDASRGVGTETRVVFTTRRARAKSFESKGRGRRDFDDFDVLLVDVGFIDDDG